MSGKKIMATCLVACLLATIAAVGAITMVILAVEISLKYSNL